MSLVFFGLWELFFYILFKKNYLIDYKFDWFDTKHDVYPMLDLFQQLHHFSHKLSK